MIPIYICEDSQDELIALIKIIEDTIKHCGLENIGIVCATKNPDELLDKITESTSQGLYYLDVDLGNGVMNGIDLGVKIHTADPGAYIVMVTTHAEAAPLTFKYKIGAKEYILKDNRKEMELRIKDSIMDGFKLISSTERKKIYFSNGIKSFSVIENQIQYVELLPQTKNRLHVCHDDITDIVYSSLHEIKNQLGKCFCQCNKSTIVNVNFITEINYKDRYVRMKRGKQIDVSVRCLPHIKKFYMHINQSF